MNKTDRRKVDRLMEILVSLQESCFLVKKDIECLHSQEERKFEKIPENLKYSTQAILLDNGIGYLQCCASELSDVDRSIGSALDFLESFFYKDVK